MLHCGSSMTTATVGRMTAGSIADRPAGGAKGWSEISRYPGWILLEARAADR
jgi:hypothetical protein